MSFRPVDTTGDGSRLHEGVQALPPSLARLRLQLGMEATREAGEDGGGGPAAWQLRQRSTTSEESEGILDVQWDTGLALWLCSAFDQPGLPCSLVGDVQLSISQPVDPGDHDVYLGLCAELGGRLRCGELALEVEDDADGAGEAGGGGYEEGGGHLGGVLGALLPGAAPHLRCLRVMVRSGSFYPGFSRHLVGGLAFPLLEELELHTYGGYGVSIVCAMAGADVAALCRLAAPRLQRIGLLAPLFGTIMSVGDPEDGGHLIHGPSGQPCAEAAVSVLAACWPPREGGRTTTIRVGCSPPDRAGGVAVAQLLQAVAGEGAAEHVVVEWAEDGDSEEEGWD